MPTSNHARQYALRSVVGHTAACFSANSHWTITSRVLEPAPRIAKQSAKDRAGAGEGQVGHHRERLRRPCPATGVGPHDRDRPSVEPALEDRRERRICLERRDRRAGVGERSRDDAGPGADVHDVVAGSDPGLPHELRCESATAKEVLARRSPTGSLPNGHGRPPSSSRRECTRRAAGDESGLLQLVRVLDRRVHELEPGFLRSGGATSPRGRRPSVCRSWTTRTGSPGSRRTMA